MEGAQEKPIRFSTMKTATLMASIGAMAFGVTTSGVLAGDWGKAPMDKTPIEECIDLGGELSVGYETDYVFYGVRFARDSVWTDVNYTFDSLAVPVTVGAWYLNGINGGGPGYDELDLYVDLTLGTFAGFDVNLGYYHYMFPEFRSNVTSTGGYGEVHLDVSRSLGFADLNYTAVEAFGGRGTAAGWFHQIGLEKSFQLCDAAAVVIGAGVGYSDGYYDGATFGLVRDSGWNHYYLTVAMPIELNCRTTLTPYLGYNGAPDSWVADGIDVGLGPQSDILHGGVSLTVSF